jgi:hypothetical protein
MERLKIQLFGALDWYEPHGRPLHGFGDCFGIAIVVLVPFAEWPNVLCRDQTDIMPQGEKSSTKVMRAGASLKANETRRQVSHASFQSSPRLSLAHSDLAASVHPDEVEDVFPQVDAHGYDLISVHCDVSHGALPLKIDCSSAALIFTLPERGRSIPLCGFQRPISATPPRRHDRLNHEGHLQYWCRPRRDGDEKYAVGYLDAHIRDAASEIGTSRPRIA